MINLKPMIFENPALYSEHTFKRNRFSDEEMMFITGKSKNKDSSSKPKMCIALNKNRYNTIFLFTHGECSLKIGLRDYVLKRGFADGTPGLIIGVSDMYYVFLKYAKLWDLDRGKKANRDQ